MFENLIKSKLNIKKEANLLIVEYKKWSFKLPIYLIIFYILHTWLGYKMKEISIITLYLYNLPFLLIFVVVALAVCSKEILVFLPLDIVKNLKIKVKESEIEDKLYTFGVCLNEEKYKEIIGEILKYSETKDYLQKLINITNF